MFENLIVLKEFKTIDETPRVTRIRALALDVLKAYNTQNAIAHQTTKNKLHLVCHF